LIRILATWEPGKLPDVDVAQGPEVLEALGALPGTERRDHFAARWDKRADFKPSDRVDLGWIGEDEEGIWTRRHPEAAILDDPAVLAFMTVWFSCSDREIRPRDVERCSAWFIRAWGIALSAQARELGRSKET
jgi:hypothetical protein